ncbi:hypothetical protein PR048_007815 [Dryococelus australis]|uniref:Uncharacterized protein n=1 Tax=Dryococelus australis TaxID=614101 RepID=A0ABQ9HVB2_9NEOP|nr:hypothetical protein PR048_007815 [Dryococelus australis]
MPHFYANSVGKFCYVCGEVTFAGQKHTITPLIRKAYFLYFGCQIGDEDKSWAPHICCNNCACDLRNWMNGKRRSMPFAMPMIWREPKGHITDSYFCLVPSLKQGISKKKKWTVTYPNLPSAVLPIPHGEGLPVAEPPDEYHLECDDEAAVIAGQPSNSKDPEFPDFVR